MHRSEAAWYCGRFVHGSLIAVDQVVMTRETLKITHTHTDPTNGLVQDTNTTVISHCDSAYRAVWWRIHEQCKIIRYYTYEELVTNAETLFILSNV